MSEPVCLDPRACTVAAHRHTPLVGTDHHDDDNDNDDDDGGDTSSGQY